MATQIKALTAFSDGVISMYAGQIAIIDDAKASLYIADGLAVAYTTPIVPTGTQTITENGVYDVTTKASADVQVPQPQGSINIDSNGTVDVSSYASAVINVSIATVTYNVNGGTGTVSAATAIKGNTISLNDGTGITPPDDKTFAGWATANDAEEPNVTSPYTVTGDITLYAVYVAAA